MKLTKSRFIALTLVFLMAFSFSLFSAFAVSNGNGDQEIKAIKVDNYPEGNNEIKDSNQPQALIPWLEDKFEIEIEAYYIKAASEQAGGGIFTSQGMLIDDPVNDPIIGKYIDNQGQAFNRNLHATVEYKDIPSEAFVAFDPGEPIPFGISHVLFLGKTPTDPEDPEGILRVIKRVEGEGPSEGYEIAIEAYESGNGSENMKTTSNNGPMFVPIVKNTNGDTNPDIILAQGTYRVWESDTQGADRVEYSKPVPENNDGPDYVVVEIKENMVTELTITNIFDEPVVPERGVTVTKVVEGTPTEDGDFEVSIEPFEMWERNGKALDFTEPDDSFPIVEAIEVDAPNTIDLEPGLYRLWESNTRGADNVSYSGDIEEISLPDELEGVVIRIPEDGYKEITITNTFDAPPPPPVLRGSVTVEHVEVDGDFNVISILQPRSNVVTNAVVGTSYSTESLDFPGFQFVRVDPNGAAASGNVTVATKHVVFQYTRIDDEPPETGSVTVEYVEIDDDGEIVSILQEKEFVVENAEVGTPYDTLELSFEGFEFVQVDPEGAPASGTVTAEDQHVVYQYIRIDDVTPPELGSVTVEYVEVNEEWEIVSILQEKAFVAENVEVGTPYETTELAFEGFRFERVDPEGAPASGTVSAEDQHVVYQYTKIVERIDDLDPPEAPVDEEPPADETPILDEEPPLGIDQLPRTGQYHVAVFMVFGLMISGLGVALKRFLAS
ncbi:MucBP domain-containing protein [Isachenkonia alkalipeptolytica]|uniref:MucBP domain-containing protein n=1 Tax=Isachenkonia alkalipeptolytica TaxID=2565777 RepID=A0AA43XM30_9CLOT|nr:MucBP domain-containing protein [Isachenkonia alkalipeptolytica]NBG88866.1 hypothetical protein [Isachenkonia alkalipeptolytica]